ncbi:MAG: hypothetical protein P0116_06665 [Candidatus Nitrosocosmicus sp.]|nr:hypothetical protein [Candidatus Nitrosocosmicus sp.]
MQNIFNSYISYFRPEKKLSLLLSIIVNEIENIKYDTDVRELFTLFSADVGTE